MEITRREFVGRAVGVLTMTVILPPQRSLDPEPTARILDLEAHCAIRESLAGYQAALATRTHAQRDVLIVPAALRIPGSAARLIANALSVGTLVIVESGAGFSSADCAEFRAHGDALRDLQIDIAPPVKLWPARGIPYVELTWPTATRVRDFSRAVPVRVDEANVIARVGDLPVGLAHRLGRGMLVFLGSPIGVALWAGDTEARRWLHEVLGTGWQIGKF